MLVILSSWIINSLNVPIHIACESSLSSANMPYVKILWQCNPLYKNLQSPNDIYSNSQWLWGSFFPVLYSRALSTAHFSLFLQLHSSILLHFSIFFKLLLLYLRANCYKKYLKVTRKTVIMLFCFLTLAKEKTKERPFCSQVKEFFSPPPSFPPLTWFYHLSGLVQLLPGDRCVPFTWLCIVQTGRGMTNLKQLFPSPGSLVAEVKQELKEHFNKHSVKKKNIYICNLLLSSLGCHSFLFLSSWCFPGYISS